jgi:hypothetical protein
MAFTSIVSRRNRVAATAGITSANIAVIYPILENPITWISPLGGNENDGDGEGDIVEKAYEDLQKKLSDERKAEKVSNTQTACEPDAFVIRREIVDFTELDCVDRGEVNEAARNVVDVIGNDAGGSWDIADLM